MELAVRKMTNRSKSRVERRTGVSGVVALVMTLSLVESCSLGEDPPPCLPQLKVGDTLILTLRNEIPADKGSSCREAVGLSEGTKITVRMVREVEANAPSGERCTGLEPAIEVPRYRFTSLDRAERGPVENEFDATLDEKCRSAVIFVMGGSAENSNLIPSDVGSDGSSPVQVVWAMGALPNAAPDSTCPPFCTTTFATKVQRP